MTMNIRKETLALLIGFAGLSCVAHAATSIPSSCETAANFFDACNADLKALNRETGGDAITNLPTAPYIRNVARTGLQKAGFEKTNQMCMTMLDGLYEKLGSLSMAAGLTRFEFSNRCQFAMAKVMMTVKSAQDASSNAGNSTPQTNSSATEPASREQVVADHRATSAVQWARSAKAQRADIDTAITLAKQALPNVALSCTDAKLIEQTPMDPNSKVYKPAALFVSKRCGYAVSYWPTDHDAQIVFDATEIDGWLGYCSTQATGTRTTCIDPERVPTYQPSKFQ
ncbi:Uncharacterised protein [Burkholderia pseudomallei]|nr:Uncharacterised protein [Burkholderia pseudomallei]CAK0073365.1 Uncharacterised protein [Burkholderia pseudomallei]